MPTKAPLPIGAIRSRVTTLSASDAVLLAGSQSLGLAHANSDYDVYVVTGAVIPPAMEYGSKTYYEDTLIDVSYVPASTVDGFVELLRASDSLSASDLDADDLELMWRLVIGTPIANEDGCARIRSELGLQRIADLIGRWRAQNAQARYLDALFLLAHGSDIAAVVAFRESAVEVACAAITEAGFAYFDTKYLFEQCAMAGPRYRPLLAELWEIEALPLSTTGVAEVHARCRELGANWVGAAFVDAAHEDAFADATVSRSLAQSLELAGPGSVVWNRAETYTLNGGAARVWEAIDGAPDASVREIAEITGISVAQCTYQLHELFVTGLVRLDWAAVISRCVGVPSEVTKAS